VPSIITLTSLRVARCHSCPRAPPTPFTNQKVLDDKIEEEEDRQAVLGKDILNPTTGLTLVDYLEVCSGARAGF
jgi:hypothetical protein